MKKSTIIISLLLCTYGLFCQNIFKKPILLKADGKAIDITTHTAPYIYDYNKDGVNDLIVGDFGDIPFDNLKEDPVYGRYTQGRCHIFINKGTNAKPIYGKSKLLMAGDKVAYVPITCCIGFVPRFVDIDSDGIDDVISGSYPGEIYLFKGLENGQFEKSVVFYDSEGDTLNVAHSTAAEPIDYDDDGDIDLIISTRMDGTFLSINQGTKSKPEFRKAVLLNLSKYDYVYEPLNEPRKRHVSHVYPSDWDNDGLFDLVCGSEEGNLVWYKNIGSRKEPEFSSASTLFTTLSSFDNVEGGEIMPIGGRVKVFVSDYDKDGKTDLLVGDFYSANKITRDLSPEEEMNWDYAKNRSSEILLDLKDMYPDVKTFRNVAFFDKFDGLSKKELKKVTKMNDERKILDEKLEKFRSLQEYYSHGYVWLFIRQ